MTERKYKDLEILRRLFRQAQPYRLHLAGVLLLSIVTAPLTLLTPVPLKIAVDSVIDSRPLPGFLGKTVPSSVAHSGPALLAFSAGLLVCIAALTCLQSLALWLLQAYTGERLVQGFRARIFRHVQRLSLLYHDTQGTADTVYRIQYDAACIQYISVDGMIPFVTSTVTLLSMLCVTARIDWQLTLVAATVSPILIFLSRTYRRRFRRRSREVKDLERSALAVIQEVMGALRVVKAFGREDHEEERYVRQSAEGVRSRLQLAFDQGQYGFFMGMTIAVGTAAVMWIAVRHVQAGAMTLGSLYLVLAYLGQLYGPLKTIGQKAGGLQGYLTSAERVFSVLDSATDVPERPHVRRLARATGAVAFRHVFFGYEPDRLVLHDVSFEIPAGARLGIAGRTGAGKTTVVSLLTRFYDPWTGQILLDGIDLRDYKLADLRNQFALVLQEPVLFSTTLAENIAYARPDASEDEIITAAKLANAHDFIASLPMGYQTCVGERGMCLSGGERQRISLARAFLKDAPILMLDEPTSSVDMRTESAIMDALERLMRGRTVLMIAHRTSTLESCDLRMELENGRVVSVAKITPPFGAGGDQVIWQEQR